MKTKPTYYDLSQSQKILFFNQSFSLNKQINNVFSLMLLNKELDFDVLRQAIAIGYDQCDTMRLRMKHVKLKMKQYYLPSDPPDIRLLDFTGKSRQEMDQELYRLAAVPIRLTGGPLNRIFIVRSWDGLQGIYLGVSHLAMDSWSICVLLKFIMDVYETLTTGKPMPPPIKPYEPLLIKDIAYNNSEQHQKDRAFWEEECKRPEPYFTHVNGPSWLERYRRKKRNPNLRGASCVTLNTKAAQEIIIIPPEQVEKMEAYCRKQMLPMQVLFMMGIRTALSARNNRQQDISFHNAVARRATQYEKRSGGTRVHVLIIRNILPEECTFIDALFQISDRQSLMFRHAEFSLLEIYKIMQKAYHPHNSLESYQAMSLTFQPIRMALNDGTTIKTLWYGNGAASHPLYLSVMDGDGTGGLRCYYEYQTKVVNPETVRQFHAELVSTIMTGIENEKITVGELLNKLNH